MNDIKELKNEELEKVSGGFRITEYSIDAGDCFENESYIFKALNDLPKTDDYSIYIDFYCYNKSLNKYFAANRNAYSIVNIATYIGKNII